MLVSSTGLVLSSACLPVDTRPPPGKVLVTATADDALVRGGTTADGWTVSYDRFLISIGHASAEDRLYPCTAYSDPDYSRVLDMRRPETQKVSLLYALGSCDFDFELSSPHADAVLGEGTTEADKSFLRTPGDDAYVTGGAASMYVAGRASKNGVVKTFAWVYRNRVDYASCSATLDGEDVQGFDVGENGSLSLDLVVRGLALFESGVTDSEAHFQPFADADTLFGDANGEITLDELALVDRDELPAMDTSAGVDLSSLRWTTLRDVVYLGQFPLVIRYRGNGTCAMEVFPNDREPR